ncbi:glutamine-rich protein 2 [Carlito syrichta]|uniref:Glutamine-rich protein 2 n=1 Tax=Carlito syrichta TaxID=1868482 RepID=A0A3Q0ED50_CARSF|nr:glutamine-rich protein 2 [Carlito syrichta]
MVWCNLVHFLVVGYSLMHIHLVWYSLVHTPLVWYSLVHTLLVCLVWANLVRISLVWANLVRISVVWANLVLISVVWANLERISLVWANLVRISVVWANLVRISLVWVNLVRISVVWDNLGRISLVWVNLEGPDFRHRLSSERSEVQTERRDSLYKRAPSFPMAVETFRLIGELIGLYVELKDRIKELDELQAGQTDLEKIQYLLAMMVQKTIPPDLEEQLKNLQTMTKEIRQEKAKLDRLQKFLDGEGDKESEELKTSQLGLQLGILRVTVADIEKELAELRDSQGQGKAAMENSVSEASFYLQNQLDKLRTIIESMLTSSSTLLSMSMAPHKALAHVAPGQIDPEATCPACSLDLSHQVSMLVARYERLQDMVSNLAASRPSKKAKLQSQDEELLGQVQSAILQVQGDCEKLNITTSNLIEDHQQKQKDITVLYQGLEKLEKEKATREHLELEIDMKADKSALATKVSRVQFDATTEQLNHMMRELVAKMTGQEQDWQKMIEKFLGEMDNKLDRLELDPVKQLLEERWKSLRQQLKERSPHYQADEAAAMRRQLLAHFHCLSCDRPLETPVTGQIIPVTPVGPGLPGHRSIRPYMVFELEQVRQQSRNLRLGGAFPRGDLGQMERSVGRLHSMHSKMLMDIEKVQMHFGGSVKASSQMIRELLQAQCLSSPCYKRMTKWTSWAWMDIFTRGEWIQGCQASGPKTPQGSQSTSPSSPGFTCTGSSPSVTAASCLLGLRVLRYQLVTTQKDRPVSSEGRLSQLNTGHLPSPTEMTSLQGRSVGPVMHMDMPPREGLEEPTRGPQSTGPTDQSYK